MGINFNPLILADKLSKLNSSQQSIETLSHWCIFHMNKAKQVVETWARQFHCAPREQRLAYLYLANDILQNSRRKGAEFVAEFWKVLPDSLRDVIENGDEFARKSAMRLVSIWEERKVFGSRGQILKEEFVERKMDNNNRNLKHAGSKAWSPSNGNGNAFGNAVDKLVSGYQAVYNSRFDEDAILGKCRNAISFIEKVDKDIEGDYGPGRVNSGTTDELKEQRTVLRDCIDQLASVESSRENLVSLLRDALQDQVHKLDQVREQLQVAHTRSEQAASIHHRLHGGSDEGQALLPEKSGNLRPEDTKSAAAAMAAKLAASTSSAQMLTFVLSSLASEGVISSSGEYPPPEKRSKIENGYVPQSSQQPPPEIDQKAPPPPPPSSPPPAQPLPPPMQASYPVPQYMQTAMPYGYSVGPQPMVPPQQAGGGYSPPSPASSYQSYPPEGGFYEQQSLPMAPMSRQ